MDAKIITGLFLCLCLMASISISQSASARLDSRLRYRRQNDETDEGSNDNAEGTAPTAQSDTGATEAVTAILIDGTTIVLPAESVATVVADDVTTAAGDAAGTVEAATAGATEAAAATAGATEADAATAAATEANAATVEAATAGATEADAATVEAVTGANEVTAAGVTVEDATDGLTSDKPGNGHQTEAEDKSNDLTTIAGEATHADDGTTVEAVTAADGATTEASAADGATTEAAAADGATTEASAADGATTEAAAVDGVTAEAVTGDSVTGEAVTSGDGTTAEAVTADGATVDESATTVADKEAATEAHSATDSEGLITTAQAGDNGDGHSTEHDDAEETTTAAVQPGPPVERAELRVAVSPDVIRVQHGQTVDLTCTVYGGDSSTSIYWIQEEPERRYALIDPAGDNDKQVAASTVTLRARITLDDPSKIGKYSCMAHDSHGNSGTATLTMEEGRGDSGSYHPHPAAPVAPSGGSGRGVLRIAAPDMTDGEYIEIQCEGAAPEDEGRIQWHHNNRLLSDEQPLYPRGKTLHIRPISRAYLGTYRCSIPNSGYTDANSVLTFGGSAPAPFIPYPPTQPVQPVQPVYPTYDGCKVDEATCNNRRCIPRSFVCDGKDDCGDNSDETCGPPEAGGADICQPNEIRCANPNRGRKCVQKFWMCDGDRDCDDGSDEEGRYCELLPRQRFCKTSEFQCASVNGTNGNPVCVPRSFQCDGYNDCPDRSDEVGCVKPTIVSPPQRQIQINAGETLIIQCTARGSPAPYINWRLNWGHICGDGYDNGRCTMVQSLDASDPTLVTGTLTVRNVKVNDGGAYSCEALNNQGFIFAIPDAIVNVIIEQGPAPEKICSCNSHSTYCSRDGRCENCQHNTAGHYCEYCAPGYQGDARRGTPYDCQLIPVVSSPRCDPSGTHMERGGRCICKYNVEGDRCDQCKRSHFYLNPVTPNGCLPCFCSGVSGDCRSSDWKRQAVPLALNNWNAVPKNFATDQYEARDRIQQRHGGREIALDQSSLGRANNEVLYWKAPKEVLGDVVTLYDGTIDVHFTNDGNENDEPSNDEFIWLRGNNIDLVHKLPKTQRFQANKNSTYSVACNERTFTRKDGTHIDRENILMALSDLDTLLIKINPIGGRRNAVLRGVTLNVAANNGYADTALTVESCHCPANYTGTSCEKCAEGYGRPHPLVGIYLGQCWSCRAVCHQRSDQCDRNTGKCSNCEGNSEGDRCERCRTGFVLDTRTHQCVRGEHQQPHPPQPVGGSRGAFYIDQKPYDSQGAAPMSIVLDGSRSEQRVPLQVLNVQPQSIVWGRTDGTRLPPNVVQEGNDLVFRNPAAEQAGNYICTITHPDGFVEHISIYVDHRPGQGPVYPVLSPASPLSIDEGSNQLIRSPGEYYRAQWTRADGQSLPSGIQQSGNDLQIVNARPDHSGTYYCQLYGSDGTPVQVTYEIHVRQSHRPEPPSGAPPRVTIQPRTINLKESQRMIVQYTVASQDPIEVVWNKLTDSGYQPIPSLFTVEKDRLVLNRATPDSAGTYQVIVRNKYGEDRQELHINVAPRRGRQRGQQAVAPQINFQQDQYEVANGASIDITPNIFGTSGAKIAWSKDGSANLPSSVTARDDGSLHIEGRSSDITGQYTLDVTNAQGQASKTIYIHFREASHQHDNYGTDNDRSRGGSYVDVRFLSRDDQSQYQVGHDIHLHCAIHGNVERPYEYTFTKDGRPLENNVEVHPDGVVIIRNAQASDSGRYRCEVAFPNAAQFGAQESSFDIQISGGSAGGHDQSYQHGGHDQSYQHGGQQVQQTEYIEVTVEPTEVTVGRGAKATVTCRVKGSDNYKVTWGKYAHDTSLPTYARQEGNTVVIAPTDDSTAEQMYLQCQVDVPGHAQPYHAYAPVNVRGGDESSKKKKKRRS